MLGAAGLGIAGAGLVALPGCGVYAAEDGEAFAPWEFPGGERIPERVVARAALLGASPHNTQPWGLAISPAAVELRARFDRNLGTMDGLRRELHIGLGCAVENMAIAAAAVGRAATISLLPDPADPALVARVALTPATARPSALFDAIPHRHTNRGPYLDGAAATGLEAALRALQDERSLDVHWLASPGERARFRQLTIDATEAITGDADMSRDSDRWYRHTAEEIAESRDGTSIDAAGLGASERTFGKAGARPSEESTNAYWIDATKTRGTTGSAFAILSSTAESPRVDQLRVGRVYQRMHLWATSQGLGMQPLNQLAERQDREEAQKLEPRFTRALASFVGAGRRAQMLFRIGYPWERAFASARRPLEWVLS